MSITFRRYSHLELLYSPDKKISREKPASTRDFPDNSATYGYKSVLSRQTCFDNKTLYPSSHFCKQKGEIHNQVSEVAPLLITLFGIKVVLIKWVQPFKGVFICQTPVVAPEWSKCNYNL